MSLSVFLAGMGQALSLMIFRSTKIKNNSYKAFVLGVGSNLKMAFSTLYTGYVQILYKRLEQLSIPVNMQGKRLLQNQPSKATKGQQHSLLSPVLTSVGTSPVLANFGYE